MMFSIKKLLRLCALPVCFLAIAIAIAIAIATSSNLAAQNRIEVKDLSSTPDWLAELMVEAKERAPEGYEFVLYPLLIDPAVSAPIPEGAKERYLKIALPTNILKDSASVSANVRYPKSTVVTTIFDVIIKNSEGNTWVIKKGTPLLKGKLFIKPPETCFLDIVSFKKGKTFLTPEQTVTNFFKYIDPKNKAEKKDEELTTRLDQLHCPAKPEDAPYLVLDMKSKPVYCNTDFFLACVDVDELSIIDGYSQYAADYLVQNHKNPFSRDLLNEIRPDTTIAMSGSQNKKVDYEDIYGTLSGIEKFENSKATMYNLFNRVVIDALQKSAIAYISMDESLQQNPCFSKTARIPSLIATIKNASNINIPQGYDDFIPGAVSKYVNTVTCSKYVFDDFEKNINEFNKVIGEINKSCYAIYEDYHDTVVAAKASKSPEVADDIINATVERYTPEAKAHFTDLMATKYFNLFYSTTFADEINKFDINDCITSHFKMNFISNNTKGKELVKIAINELKGKAIESINELTKTRTQNVTYTDIGITNLSGTASTIANIVAPGTLLTTKTVNASNEGAAGHKERENKLKKYLLSYTKSFKQYISVAAPSSREFLLSTKLIGELYDDDETQRKVNVAIELGAGLLATAGAILTLTGVGAPVGSLVGVLSAVLNSYAVFTISTAAIMINAGINYDKASSAANSATIAGVTGERDNITNYSDLKKALDAKSGAIKTGLFTVGMLAVPVAGYALLKNIPAVSNVLGISEKTSMIEMVPAARTFDRGSYYVQEAGLQLKPISKFLSESDDALLKSVVGKSGTQYKSILEDAAKIKSQKQYDKFVENLNKSVGSDGKITYTSMSSSHFVEPEPTSLSKTENNIEAIKTAKVSTATNQVSSTVTKSDILKKFGIAENEESLAKLDHMMNNAYTKKIEPEAIYNLSKKEFDPEWKFSESHYKNQETMCPNDFDLSVRRFKLLEDGKKAPITGKPDDLFIRVTTKDDIVYFLNSYYRPVPRNSTPLATEILGKKIMIYNDVLDEMKQYYGYITKNRFDYESGGSLLYKETNGGIEIVGFMPKECAAVSIRLHQGLKGNKMPAVSTGGSFGDATQLTIVHTVDYREDMVKEIFGNSKHAPEYDRLTKIEDGLKKMDVHSHHVYSPYQTQITGASPLDYKEVISAVFTPGKTNGLKPSSDFNLLLIVNDPETGAPITTAIGF